MVHAMQSPQQRHGVEQHMLRIDRKVEQDDRQHDRHSPRHGKTMKPPPAARPGQERDASSSIFRSSIRCFSESSSRCAVNVIMPSWGVLKGLAVCHESRALSNCRRRANDQIWGHSLQI
jgi:hypothetical protein